MIALYDHFSASAVAPRSHLIQRGARRRLLARGETADATLQRERRREPVHDAVALTTGLERQHEAWAFHRAARGDGTQAKAAMEPMHAARTRFRHREERIPQERAIGEHPPAGALWFPGERRGQQRRKLLVVSARLSSTPLVESAHLPFFQIGGGRAFRLLVQVGITGHLDSAIFFERRSAPLTAVRTALLRSGERATGFLGLVGACRLAVSWMKVRARLYYARCERLFTTVLQHQPR